MKISPKQSKRSLVTTLVLLVGLVMGLYFQYGGGQTKKDDHTLPLPAIEWKMQLLETDAVAK